MALLESPPLSLYVHLPWCVRKCPYCDFNSHAARGDIPADQYVDALLRDLEQDLPLVWGRPVQSVFFGGGTPSLFSAPHFERLLSGFRALLPFSPALEITLEANPGTIERDSFSAYRDAGINRVSLGVQSFCDQSLAAIGRIHGRRDALGAVESLHASGIENFNIDLMFALPGQDLATAEEDIRTAISCAPAHISHYQLTIEPNTAFHADPPVLPAEDVAWEMQETAGSRLAASGYEQYEVSAWSKPGFHCAHNLNYWHYGDYLGIGAGAHSKITVPAEASVRRRVRVRHPLSWMRAVTGGEGLAADRSLPAAERVFEFFLNQLRLKDGVRKSMLGPRTGADWPEVAGRVNELLSQGLLEEAGDLLVPTDLGWRFSNASQAIFLP